MDTAKVRKVTGIGGIFFKCKNPDQMKEWYKNHLGLETDQYGTNFQWYQSADAAKKYIHNGASFLKTQNILKLPPRIL